MAYRLMEKYSITKEEIIGPPHEKPRIDRKENNHSNNPYAGRYEYHNGWYYYNIPESWKMYSETHKLTVSFSNAVKGLKGLYFEVGNSFTMVRSNNPELLFRYEMELRERMRMRQQRDRDETYMRAAREKYARERAERERQDAAFMKKMTIMGALACTLMLVLAIIL